MYFDGNYQELGLGATFIAPAVAYTLPYRNIHNSVSNFLFENFSQVWQFGLFYLWGAPTLSVELHNFTFRNVSSNFNYIQVLFYYNLEFTNFTFENSDSHQVEAIFINTFGNILFDDFTFRNYSNTDFAIFSPFSIGASEGSTVTYQNFVVENLQLSKVPFIQMNSPTGIINLHNFQFTNIIVDDEGSLLTFQNMYSISMENITFENIHPKSDSDSTARIINVPTMNVGNMASAQFKNFSITNSAFSLIKVDTLANLTPDERNLVFENIRYSNCHIPTKRTLISTHGLSADTNLNIIFRQLSFEDISFENGGNLIEFTHQLPNFVEITDSTFTGITSGNIQSIGSRIHTDLDTKFRISDSVFSEIQSPQSPFLSIREKSIMEATNSSFMKFTSFNLIGGAIRAMESSKMVITD